jgi:hypothetical protein
MNRKRILVVMLVIVLAIAAVAVTLAAASVPGRVRMMIHRRKTQRLSSQRSRRKLLITNRSPIRTWWARRKR